MNRLLLPIIPMAIGLLLILSGFLFRPAGSGSLDLEIKKTGFIMPAAHNVYNNPDALGGKYYLFKALLKNTSRRTLEGITVRYRVPGYIDWTELDEIGQMFPGQSAVVACYPRFSEDITEKMTESTEKVEIEIDWEGAGKKELVEESFSFKMVNRNDFIFTGIEQDEIATWGDGMDNYPLLASFVTPNDPIVKYYTQIIQEKVLRGEQAGVTRDPKEAVRFLLGIYETTLRSHMVYSGTKFLPRSLDEFSSSSQHNRLPREVITGNTGLCLELSLLYASVLSAAGIDPVIFLVPGHAYPGFRMNGQYFAIEATGIGGEGLGNITSVEDAFKKGQKQLQEFFQRAQAGDPRYTLLDVHAVRAQGVTPMALKDDDFMRKKVDEIVAGFTQPASGNQPAYAARNQSRNTPSGRRTRPASAPISFSVPPGWQTASNPYPQVPIISFQAVSPDQTANALIYDVPATSVNEALQVIQQYLAGMGSQVQYQINGNVVNGQTHSANGLYLWKGRTQITSAGVRIVTIGSPQMYYQQNAPIINSVYNSIR